MRRFRLARILLFALCTAHSAAGQPLRFERVGLEQGLPDHTIFDIQQDHRGFLWLASEGGLIRYDGYEFKTYQFDPARENSLSSNVLSAVFEDRSGFIWVGTNQGGLNRFDPRTASVTRYSAPDPGARIQSFAQDSLGGLWARPAQIPHALYHLPPGASGFRPFALPDSFRQSPAPPVLSSEASVWSLGTGGHLYRLDLADGRIRSYELSYPQATVPPGLVEDQQGSLWIRAEDTLIRLSPETGAVERFRVPGIHRIARALRAVYVEGVLWMSTAAGLHVVRVQSGEMSAYHHVPGDPHSLTGDVLTSLLQDRAGIIWISVLNAGLCRLIPQQLQFRHYYHIPFRRNALAQSHVYGIFEKQGQLYVSTAAGGIQRLDDDSGTFEAVNIDWTGEKVPLIRTMLSDRFGGTWYGSWGDGLFHADDRARRAKRYRFPGNRDANAMRILYQDLEGVLWVGTERGLLRYDRAEDRFETFPTPEYGKSTLSGATIWTILERNGKLWLGTYGRGLFIVDRASRSVRQFEHRPDDLRSLSSNNVSVLAEDRSGRLWIGTYGGGLNLWDESTATFARRTKEDGFADPYVDGILEDDRGDLWISTNGGLIRYSPKTDAYETYRAEDGLQSNRFGPGVFLKRADGSLVFGGVNGFNWFRPEELSRNEVQPAVVVTAFSIRGRPVALDSLLSLDEAVRIPWYRNEFSFEAAALDFAAPEKNSYAHRLDGLDPSWRRTGTRRVASYANLSPGRYVLRVRGASGGGIWSRHVATVPIVIVPPFWMTAWFRVLAVAGLVTMTAFVARGVATRRLRRRLQQLEFERRLEAERGRISRDLHDHVGAQLTYLIASIDMSAHQLSEAGATAQHSQLQALRSNAQMMMRQLREAIWALQQDELTVTGLIERLHAHAAQLSGDAARPRIHVHRSGPEEAALSPTCALNSFRIGQETITNSIKHANAENLTIAVRVENSSELVLLIEDDGIGMTEPARKDGYGLENMRRRAEELEATLTIDERSEGGTRIRLAVRI